MAEPRNRARDAQKNEAAYRHDEGEVELTGEESGEQDELPDDLDGNRSE